MSTKRTWHHAPCCFPMFSLLESPDQISVRSSCHLHQTHLVWHSTSWCQESQIGLPAQWVALSLLWLAGRLGLEGEGLPAQWVAPVLQWFARRLGLEGLSPAHRVVSQSVAHHLRHWSLPGGVCLMACCHRSSPLPGEDKLFPAWGCLAGGGKCFKLFQAHASVIRPLLLRGQLHVLCFA